jgi:ATP-binding cassette subfamily B protein/subfamily B ATP-binding cassette protein MsbA
MKPILRLLPYAKPYRSGLAFVVVTMAVAVALDLLRPWPTKLLIDQVLGGQAVPDEISWALDRLPGSGGTSGLLLWVCLGTVLIFLLRSLLAMAQTAVSTTLGQRMVYDLGADLFAHVQRLSLLFHSRRSLGDLVGRVTVDSYCLQVLIASTLLPLFQSTLTLVAMFVVMWRLEPTMTLFSLTVVPFLTLLIYTFGGKMKERSRARRDLEGRMMAVVEQTLAGIPAVQAFTREEAECRRFKGFSEEAVRAYGRSVLVDMWFKLLVGAVTAVGTAGIMWLGARYALEGRVSPGTILVFLAYLTALYEPLNALVYTASLVQYAAANADRVLEVLDTPADVQDVPGAVDVRLKGHVRYEDVAFGYGGEPVIRGVTLEARPGEVLAIVGPTGAGKTTLVSLLLRFFDSRRGRVTVDGLDIRQLRVACLRRQVAVVLQEPFLFPLSVAENLAFGCPEATREEVVAAARAANAHEFICRLPQGYETIIGEKGATLSGGEKQRLAIARALVKDAPILILDEPTAALDANTEALLLGALEKLMAGRTTFVIAHRLSTIRDADRIVVLDRGRIVEQGGHEDLMKRGSLYAKLYSQQMGIVRHDAREQDATAHAAPWPAPVAGE